MGRPFLQLTATSTQRNMAKPNPEKSTTSKGKKVQRKKDKPDLCAWLTDDSTDDTDIGPWMVRRVDGETRLDLRSAPPFNKFLWASKSLCKAIENISQFAHESLHEHFQGRVQVRLTQIPAGLVNKPDDKSVDTPVAVHKSLTKSASNVLGLDSNEGNSNHINGGASNRCQHATVNMTDCVDVEKSRDAVAQDSLETEVTRLKRLIAIARRYRQEFSEGVAQSKSCEVDNPYTSYISISSEPSDATGDSGVSLSSLKSHLAEVDGVWALEYINGDSENCYTQGVLGKDHSLNQPVRFSYTQGNNGRGSTLTPSDNKMMIVCDHRFSEDWPLAKEPTPFITALENYRENHGDIDGIQPLVRSLKFDRAKECHVNGLDKNEISKTISPRSSGRLENNPSGDNISTFDMGRSDHDTSKGNRPKGDTNARPSSGASLKIQKFKIILPNRDSDVLESGSNRERTLSTSANVILQKFRENGVNATAYVKDEGLKPDASCRASSAVFPVGRILPGVDTTQQKGSRTAKRESGSHGLRWSSSLRDSCLSDNVNITANDLLLHRGDPLYDGDRYYLVQSGEMLGPPPFRPMANRTPLHRARDTTRKRMYGHGFAQETQDLYQKLILAKNGVTDHRQDLVSGRRRSGNLNSSASRSAGNSRRWTGRPLGHTVTETEFHEARASLSARCRDFELRKQVYRDLREVFLARNDTAYRKKSKENHIYSN